MLENLYFESVENCPGSLYYILLLILKCLVLLTILFCKYVFSTNDYLTKGRALSYRHVTLLVLVASLNRFLLDEIPSTQKHKKMEKKEKK